MVSGVTVIDVLDYLFIHQQVYSRSINITTRDRHLSDGKKHGHAFITQLPPNNFLVNYLTPSDHCKKC